jgi:hypothetical protein
MTVVGHDNDLFSDSALKHMVLTHYWTYYKLCVLGERKKKYAVEPVLPFKCDNTLGHLPNHAPISAECDPGVLQ